MVLLHRTLALAVVLVSCVVKTHAAGSRTEMFDEMFARADATSRAAVDAWTAEETQQAHKVVTSAIEEVRLEHETAEGTESGDFKSFMKTLFNCKYCGMDDGSNGLTEGEKTEGKESEDSLEDDTNADMKIQRVFALEWAVAPEPSPYPNPMVSFICDPQSKLLAHSTSTDTDELKQMDEKASDSSDFVNTAEEDSGESQPPKSKSLFKMVLDKIVQGLKFIGKKAAELFRELGKILYVIVRCAICVFCNLINIVKDLLEYIKKKALNFGEILKDKGHLVMNGFNKRLGQMKENKAANIKKRIEEGGGDLGGYCKIGKDCKSGNCRLGGYLSKNYCVGSKTFCETREQECHKHNSKVHSPKSNSEKCISRGCTYTQKDGCSVNLEGSCKTAHETSFVELDNEMVTFEAVSHEQRIHRIADNLHRAGAFDDHEAFAYKHLASPAQTASMLTGMASFLQMSATVQSSGHAHTGAFVQLPNRCVNATTLGWSYTIAINYENPSLLEALFSWNLKDALPELLVAISPISVEGSNVRPQCLLGEVGPTRKSEKEIQEETIGSLKKDADDGAGGGLLP